MVETGLIRAVVALLFVLALIAALAWAMRRWQGSRLSNVLQQGRRLVVQEQLYLDPRRKVVLLRCDEQEYLVLLGAQGEQVITTGIKVKSREKSQTA